MDELEVAEVTGAAGIGDGAVEVGGPGGEGDDEVLVDAALEALDVGGVDEELGAVGSEAGESFGREEHVGEGLPLVDGDSPRGGGGGGRGGRGVGGRGRDATTAEVDDETVGIAAESRENGIESGLAEAVGRGRGRG